MWLVEFNIGRYRIRRWATHRWHLWAPDPRSFATRESEWPLHPADVGRPAR